MKAMKWQRLVFAGMISAAMLTGCQTGRLGAPGEPRATPATMETAEKAEHEGQYVVAAREYMRLAATVKSPQKQNNELRAVEALIKAGQSAEARSLLRSIDVTGLDSSFQARKRIMDARLLSLEGAHEKAIRTLDEAAKARNLNPSLLADIYLARSQAEQALDNPIGAVRNLISRESLLVSKETLTSNQTQIWNILSALPRARLASERQLTGDTVLGGWIDLALTKIDNAGNRQRLEDALAQWRALNLKHPASESLVGSMTKSSTDIIGHIDRIALLLPLSSPYAVAADAVREGFLAMDKANTNKDKPTIQIYDVGADAARIPEIYKTAVKDGAQLVVGPLGREAAENLVRNGGVSVPTLLLSHIDDEPTQPALLFQFGLPPEQEARQVAERAYLDGHRQAAVLYPQNAWGERMMNAFVSSWQRLGGIVVSSQTYVEDQPDQSETIKQLLNMNYSFARKERLEKVLRARIPTERYYARPRQDIDFIFLAADAPRGRLIKPQLNFFQASQVPVYSTSHIFTGKVDPLHDSDLDGIIFGDMPWMLANDPKTQQLRQTLQSGWPHARSDLDRLYALGMDSYAILPQLNRISTETGVRFNGVTSGLSLDPAGKLQRSLIWARFNRGAPKLIDNSLSRPALELEPAPAGR